MFFPHCRAIVLPFLIFFTGWLFPVHFTFFLLPLPFSVWPAFFLSYILYLSFAECFFPYSYSFFLLSLSLPESLSSLSSLSLTAWMAFHLSYNSCFPLSLPGSAFLTLFLSFLFYLSFAGLLLPCPISLFPNTPCICLSNFLPFLFYFSFADSFSYPSLFFLPPIPFFLFSLVGFSSNSIVFLSKRAILLWKRGNRSRRLFKKERICNWVKSDGSDSLLGIKRGKTVKNIQKIWIFGAIHSFLKNDKSDLLMFPCCKE